MESKTNGVIEEVWYDQPVSPKAQYLSSSALSISILGVFETEVPIDTSTVLTLLENVFDPINKRFSSIMVTDEQGVKHWKTVNSKFEDHLKVPIFPNGLSPESYDVHLQEYLSKIAMDQLPQTRPLWEVHIINYTTSNAAATCIPKLHHALGDGYSLMGALLSCSRRADDPSLPLTFPSIQSIHKEKKNMFKSVLRNSSMLWNTALDFVSSFLKSTVVADDETPIKSRVDGMEFRPINVSTTTFSLDHINQIKAKIGGTVNDIVVGTIFYGLRLYMQSVSKDSNHSQSTSLVLLNTRGINGYVTVEEMLKPKAKSPWGNQFAFIHETIPNSKDAETEDPIEFISKTRKMIKRNKRSLPVYLTGRLLETMRKLRGAETASRYIYKTLRNTSMAITNLIEPVEQRTIGDYPCKGMYFVVVNSPQSLMVSMMSYMGKPRLAIGAEKDYIDHQSLISCFDQAFSKILQAALTKTSRDSNQKFHGGNPPIFSK